MRAMRGRPFPFLRRLPALLTCLLLLTALPALAVQRPPVSGGLPDYEHTAWRVGQGAPGDIWDITQDRDGLLWLATGSGLYRFDGRRFERQPAPAGSHFPSTNMVTLAHGHDGALWIGYFQAGISRFAHGQLHSYGRQQGVPVGVVPHFSQDREGQLWAAINGGLRRFDGQRWQPMPASAGLPERRVQWVLHDSRGTFWVVADLRIWMRAAGQATFKDTGIAVSQMATLAESPQGEVWLADRVRGTSPLANAQGLLPDSEREARRLPALVAARLQFTADGALWATMSPHGGVARVTFAGTQAVRMERFDSPHGLTATSAVPIIVDREGNLWVGTNLGLNRFRARSVHTLVVGPSDPYRSLARASDGRVYGYGEDLRPYDLQRHLLDGSAPQLQAAARQAPTPIWQFDWVNLARTVAGHTTLIPLPAPFTGQPLHALLFPDDTQAWVCTGERGVLQYLHGQWRQEGRLPEQACSSLALDARGQLLLGYADGRLRRMGATRIDTLDARQGLSVGPVTAILQHQELLLVAGEAGLAARLGEGRFVPVRTDMAGVLEGITGMVADPNGHLWLNGSRGLVRLESGPLRAALRSGQPVTPRLFDAIDGMPGIALQSGPIATAVLADDGLLWLATNQGLAWLDTTRSHVNAMAPSVRIGEVLYGSMHAPLRDGLRLPAGTSQLQIDYVALSLARPERNRYRYRLSGVDDGWQDAGSSTRAYYTNLAPGKYRFEVEAANEDGIWSTAPASRSFRIAPTFVQTVWFKLLCAAAILALLVMAVRIRSGQLAALFRARLQERNGERERIARDLHDTLLQGSQGLILRLHAISQSAQTPEPVRSQLESAMQLAERNLAEGRERVNALREGPFAGRDLASALADVHAEYAGHGTNPLRLTVEGTAPPLQADAAEEVFLIGREAIRNALRHASASAIEVELSYGARCFLLHVRDDGVGIADENAGHGHWGLQGMRERAQRLGAELQLWTRPGLGTEVALAVPARRLYHRRPSRWRWPWRRTSHE
ncbi:two-component regulator propeller domain-containing protein [Stenotrophomonas pavanii]|uniref:sensor histidine kinase n=1 Tax=Stenotrophomonas pavanii TaxID=487698 RepID=UPI0028960CF0|nr:two-component regulator propeller domain-containing protein [Stenotrophomonas pavanii]MDT3454246.1 two-component regulator propeller domain-containing protein [Stenotrophomonas pavanii]MDT3464162.1 two-component regulator propeller domain-containing protein [Stenotrophomonas pavanii]